MVRRKGGVRLKQQVKLFLIVLVTAVAASALTLLSWAKETAGQHIPRQTAENLKS